MFNKIIIKFGTLLIVLLTAFGAEAVVKLRGLNLLEDVVSFSKTDESNYNIEFTKPLKEFYGPSFFKKSIQLDFPNTYIKPSKQTYPINNSIISEVFVAQIDPKTVRLRFVLENDGINLRNQFRIEKEGRFLNINIGTGEQVTQKDLDITSVEKPLAQVAEASIDTDDALDDILNEINKAKKTLASSQRIQLDSQTTPAAIETKQTEKQPTDQFEQVSNIPYKDQLQSIIRRKDPLPETSKAKRKSPVQRTENPTKPLKFLDYEGDMIGGTTPGMPETAGKMISSLALVIGLMFIIFYGFKKLVLKNGLMGGNTNAIKVLGTGVLGSKKSVALVEVAGEVLVLGISDDRISLLSKIEDKEKIEELKTAPTPSITSVWNKTQKQKPKPIVAENKIEKKKEKMVNNQVFADYVRQFSNERSGKNPSISKATNSIQKNLGRLRTA